MINSLKAEFRKLLTVRSTYFLCLVIVGLTVGLIGFWIYGYKDTEHAAINAEALRSSIFAAVSVTGVFLSFVTVMLVGHEYRYNGILYSLTATNRRTKLFLAKLLAVSIFSLIVAAIVVSLNAVSFYAGLHAHHISATAQRLDVADTIWRSLVTILGDVIFAFIITMLVRSLIAAIAVVLLLPSTIEQLLALILKDNVKYLPYTALGNVTVINSPIQFSFSLLVVAAYVLVFGLFSYVLFLRRDAN